MYLLLLMKISEERRCDAMRYGMGRVGRGARRARNWKDLNATLAYLSRGGALRSLHCLVGWFGSEPSVHDDPCSYSDSISCSKLGSPLYFLFPVSYSMTRVLYVGGGANRSGGVGEWK